MIKPGDMVVTFLHDEALLYAHRDAPPEKDVCEDLLEGIFVVGQLCRDCNGAKMFYIVGQQVGYVYSAVVKKL